MESVDGKLNTTWPWDSVTCVGHLLSSASHPVSLPFPHAIAVGEQRHTRTYHSFHVLFFLHHSFCDARTVLAHAQTWEGKGLDSPWSMTSRDPGSLRAETMGTCVLSYPGRQFWSIFISSVRRVLNGQSSSYPQWWPTGQCTSFSSFCFILLILYSQFLILLTPKHCLCTSSYLHILFHLRICFLQQSWLRYTPKQMQSDSINRGLGSRTREVTVPSFINWSVLCINVCLVLLLHLKKVDRQDWPGRKQPEYGRN